jgi:serine/threonine-protein kinase RsbW
MVMQTDAVLLLTPLWWPGDGPWKQATLSCAADLEPFLDRVQEAMLAEGYAARTCREVRLVLEEAILNGLHHGNGGDPSKTVRIRYRVLPEAVLADVEDEGPGFDAATVPDPTAPENRERPSGRGLLLMRRYASWLHYHGRGNRLSLCKYRPPR